MPNDVSFCTYDRTVTSNRDVRDVSVTSSQSYYHWEHGCGTTTI